MCMGFENPIATVVLLGMLAGCIGKGGVDPEGNPDDGESPPTCYLNFGDARIEPESVVPVNWTALNQNAPILTEALRGRLDANETQGTIMNLCSRIQPELDWLEFNVEQANGTPTYFTSRDALYFAITQPTDGTELLLSLYARTPNRGPPDAPSPSNGA